MSERETRQEAADEPSAAEAAEREEAAAEAAADDASGAASRPSATYLVWGLVVLVAFFAGLAVWPIAGPRLFESWRGAGGDDARLAAALAPLTARLDALERKLAEPDDARSVEIEALRSAIAAETSARREGAAALEQRLESLETRLSEARTPNQALDASVERLTRRFAALEQQVAEAEGVGTVASKIEDEIAALGDRLGAIESDIAEARAAGRRQSLVLAVGQLAAALSQGQSYRAELERLTGLAGEDAEISTAVELLAPTAERGVASLAELKRRFEALADDIVRAGNAPASDGWLEQAAGRLQQLVTVRRTGEVEGSETDAVVARAEIRLAEGDLAAAVRELSTLQGAAAEAAAPWRQAAEQRLLAERAIGRLQARAIELLGQS